MNIYQTYRNDKCVSEFLIMKNLMFHIKLYYLPLHTSYMPLATSAVDWSMRFSNKAYYSRRKGWNRVTTVKLTLQLETDGIRKAICLSQNLLGFYIFRAVGSIASTDPRSTSQHCSTSKVEVKHNTILVYCEQRHSYCVHG